MIVPVLEPQHIFWRAQIPGLYTDNKAKKTTIVAICAHYAQYLGEGSAGTPQQLIAAFVTKPIHVYWLIDKSQCIKKVGKTLHAHAFLEPACDGQHGYQVPSVNSGFVDILIREQMQNSN